MQESVHHPFKKWGEYSGRRIIWKKLNSYFQMRLSQKDKTQNIYFVQKNSLEYTTDRQEAGY